MTCKKCEERRKALREAMRKLEIKKAMQEAAAGIKDMVKGGKDE